MIKAIFACDLHFGIGKYRSLPWPVNKEDLNFFYQYTKNNVVVMGGLTASDPNLPFPLKNRINVVVTNSPSNYPFADDYIMNPSTDSLIQLQEQYHDKDIIVIGGSSMFNLFFPVIDELVISRINFDYNCDVFLDRLIIDTKFMLECVKCIGSELHLEYYSRVIWEEH